MKEREEKLAVLLKQTQEQCAADLSAAEREATQRVEAAREEAVRSVDRRRADEVTRIEAEVSGLQESLAARVRELETTAERNGERAVSLVLGSVWPEVDG